MDVLIISNYWHFECEKMSSRYLTIANMLCDNNMDVEVVTSSFYHTNKKQRNIKEKLSKYKFKTTLLYEPGYKKNIDPKRIISHKVFACNVLKYLKNRKKPDVIYLFVPPIDLGNSVVKYCNQNKIKVIIDILDLWPEAYNMILPCQKLIQILLTRMRHKANRIYAGADEIVAVSQTYLDRAIECNRNKRGEVVYIGIDLSMFDSFAKNAIKNKYEKDSNELVFVYIGMLGHSYDLKCAIDAIELLERKKYGRHKLLVMGDGPLKDDFENYANIKKINAEFTGRLSYDEMIKRLVQCDISLNLISHGAVQSIINKHADYLSAGLPIINNQEVNELEILLNKYNCGITCKNSDYRSVCDAMIKLVTDRSLRLEMGKNARKLAKDKFDRKKSYQVIVKIIEKMHVKGIKG